MYIHVVILFRRKSVTEPHSTALSFQFHRSFPGPPDVTPAEVDTLAQRYYDPTTGLYNYLHFHNDLSTIGAEGTEATVTLTQPPSIPVHTQNDTR